MRGCMVRLAWLPLAAGVLGACERTALDPAGPPPAAVPPARASVVDGLPLGLSGDSAVSRFTICSLGADATYAWRGSGWHSFVYAGVPYAAGAPDSGTVFVASGGASARQAWASRRCVSAFRYTLPVHGSPAPVVRATYQPQPGFRLDSIVRDSVRSRDLRVYLGPVESDSTARGASAMSGVVHNDVGQIVFFYFSRFMPCTRSIAWWKAHGSPAGQGDAISPLLPVWLGSGGAALSVQVSLAGDAMLLLSRSTPGSSTVQRLYAELLATKLNLAAGANGSAVAATVAAADAFLARHDDVTTSLKPQVLGWITTLDGYNSGLIGPGHCPG